MSERGDALRDATRAICQLCSNAAYELVVDENDEFIGGVAHRRIGSRSRWACRAGAVHELLRTSASEDAHEGATPAREALATIAADLERIAPYVEHTFGSAWDARQRVRELASIARVARASLTGGDAPGAPATGGAGTEGDHE